MRQDWCCIISLPSSVLLFFSIAGDSTRMLPLRKSKRDFFYCDALRRPTYLPEIRVPHGVVSSVTARQLCACDAGHDLAWRQWGPRRRLPCLLDACYHRAIHDVFMLSEVRRIAMLNENLPYLGFRRRCTCDVTMLTDASDIGYTNSKLIAGNDHMPPSSCVTEAVADLFLMMYVICRVTLMTQWKTPVF